MSQPAPKSDYERIAALREGAWELLDEYLKRPRDGASESIIVCLQNVANELGGVERRLVGERSDAPDGARSADEDQPAPIIGRLDVREPELPVSGDASVVLALAEVSVPLAGTREDEVERWLRVMRGHGVVGEALRELGMSPRELSTPSSGPRPLTGSSASTSVTAVAAEAAQLASERGAQSVTTVDVLFAVIWHYGPLFDRALYGATGTDQGALLATVASGNVPARA
jgi:hypothetical protein